ncbi:MAG: hypothetical protein NTZ10_01755 [Candidatus Saganbacteria bacterium]|nr:hypothetical protein [Candidatus Saganbacteria bacterium]
MLYIEGGEPTLELDNTLLASRLGAHILNMYGFSLESNLSWASTEDSTTEMLSRLATQGIERNRKIFVTGGNLDSFHDFVPLQNHINLVRQFWRYFPSGEMVFSRLEDPNDDSVTRFIQLLKEQGWRCDYKEIPTDPELYQTPAVEEINIDMGSHAGGKRKICIQHKFPVLVGRGKQLRQTPYLDWLNAARGKQVDMREDKSTIFPEAVESEGQIVSIGWDGLVYLNPMFMHTQTYPLGSIDEEDLYSIIKRANKDPLVRRLVARGFGSIFRVAAKIFPQLAHFDPRLGINEICIDTLQNPEQNLAILEGILREEGELTTAAARLKSAPDSIDIKAALQDYASRDWTGIENTFVWCATDKVAELTVEKQIETISATDLKGFETQILFSLVMRAEEKRKKELLCMAVADKALLLKLFGPPMYSDYIDGQKEFACKVFAGIIAEKGSIPLPADEKEEKPFLDVLVALLNIGAIDIFFKKYEVLPGTDQAKMNKIILKDADLFSVIVDRLGDAWMKKGPK